MAEKEERILVVFGNKPDIDEFPYLFPWDKLEKTKRKVFDRSEAVERMAKAIFTEIWGLPNNRFDLAKSSVKVRNRKLAEAALNALLEANNA